MACGNVVSASGGVSRCWSSGWSLILGKNEVQRVEAAKAEARDESRSI